MPTRSLSIAVVLRRMACLAWLAGAWACVPAFALDLPAQAELQQRMGTKAATVTVVEPHLSTKAKPVRVDYVGYPATQVLDKLFGAEWKGKGLEIEFRALDGYVSRIPVERFGQYRAHLVFERKGQREFEVNNILQNEKRVPLGPYYLVWDNIRSPELIAEGGSYWPYQIKQISVSSSRLSALLPAGMGQRYSEHAALAQKLCLNCHQLNGYGGEKMPINLAARVKEMDEAAFMAWVLTPRKLKPDTTMPALSETMPEGQRQATAKKLYAYLKAVPVAAK